MSETTIIPPSGSTTPGFHAHEGGGHYDSLLVHQQLANEARINQKSVYDVALSNKDSVERTIISQKSDAEHLADRINNMHLETIKQADITRTEALRQFEAIRREIADSRQLALTLDKERVERELADMRAEVRFLKAQATATA